MATTGTEPEVLEVGVDLKQVLADMAKWQRAMMKNMDGVSKAVERLNQTSTKANKKAIEGTEDWAEGIEDLAKAYKKEGAEIEQLSRTIDELQKKSMNAADDEKAAIEEQIKGLRRITTEKTKALKAKEKKEGLAAAGKMMKESGEELGKELKDTFEDISKVFSKDLKGAIDSSTKNLVRVLKTGAGGIAVGGSKLRNFGMGFADRGKARGGMGGKAMELGGGAMKQLGGLMSKMGPLIQTLSKIGPILGSVSTAIVGLVKLFLDMDAKVKEFNKDILASASNTEFLAATGGDADVAFDDLQTTLRGVRDAAYAYSNIDWGISADQHKAILNILNQEGVSLKSIGDQAGKSSEEIQAFVTDLAHVSVAYSRAFGVPLQEINTMQAEMTQEMGVSLGKTAEAFEKINKAAAETGVGANKFFAMIRSASQDMTLWGNRMDQAVTLMGKLMKVMSPRSAQAFFQTIQKGFKGMSRTDLLQTTLLAGTQNMLKSVQSEIGRNTQKLAGDIGEALHFDPQAITDLAEKIKTSGRAAVEPLIDKLPKEMQGSVRETLTKMELMQSRAKKGAYGIGEAATELSPVAAAEMKRASILRITGAKSLKEGAGNIGVGAMAEKQGISVEEVNHYVQLEDLIKDQKDMLKKKLLDPSVQKKLAKAGIKGTAEAIDDAPWASVFDTMEEDQQDLINGVSETEKMAKKQAKAQMSFYEKFDQLIDFLMNQLYDIMTDIWDAITSLSIFGGDKKEKEVKKAVAVAKDPEMTKILKSVDGNIYKFRGELGKKYGKEISDALTKDQAGTEQILDKLLKQMAPGNQTAAVYAGARSAGIDNKIADKLAEMVGYGKDLSKAAEELGVKGDQRKALMNQVGLAQLDPALVATLVAKVHEKGRAQGDEEGAPPKPAAPSAAAATPVQQPKPVVRGGGPAATPPTPAAASTGPAADTKIDDSLDLSKEQLQAMQAIDNKVDKFRMDTTFLSGPYSKAVEGSVLKAVRTALFEYYMYKDLDQGAVVNAMQSRALNPASFSESFTMGSSQGKTGEQTLDTLSKNAAGGTVTGVSNGLAQVTAAAGEGLASVGPGERIVPRGGGKGGDTYQINVNGVGGSDLARIIEAKVVDGVHEYKRRERFTG